MNWLVVSQNNSIFAQRIAKIFNMKFSTIVNNGFDGLFFVEMNKEQIESAQNHREVPKIIFWTGSDLRNYLTWPKLGSFGNAIHITDSPWIVKDLKKGGISAHFVRMPCYLPQNIDIGFPSQAGILFYLINNRAQDLERTKAVIRCIKDIPIFVMRGHSPDMLGVKFQENVASFPFMPEELRFILFKQTSIYIRLMHVDGMSQMVAEAKYFGRHVFYTKPARFCNLVLPKHTPEYIASWIREERFRLPDKEGSDWYRKYYSPDRFAKTLNSICRTNGWGEIIN